MESIFNTRADASGGIRAEINITPLVDVLLVLLVIFMVTAPALAMRAEVRLPQAGPVMPVPPPRMTLDVGASGQWWLDGVALSRPDAQARLYARATRSPDLVLTVQAQGDGDYQLFVDAIATAQRSGVGTIVTSPR